MQGNTGELAAFLPRDEEWLVWISVSFARTENVLVSIAPAMCFVALFNLLDTLKYGDFVDTICTPEVLDVETTDYVWPPLQKVLGRFG